MANLTIWSLEGAVEPFPQTGIRGDPVSGSPRMLYLRLFNRQQTVAALAPVAARCRFFEAFDDQLQSELELTLQ